MKLFRSPPLSKLQSRAWVGARLAADRSSLPRGWSDSLFNRLVLAGDPRVSIVPILDKWVDEGKPVEKRDLQWMVKQMRASRRYSHALQISMWMSDRRYFTLSPGDIADRLGLLSKVHDIACVENYFNDISKQLKVRQSYGALLNCYAEAKDVEKAEALFQEMKELKLLTPFCYNILVKLYSLTGQHRKVDTIFQEMERKRFRPDNFTHNIFMDAYVIACDISGIEKLLKRINHSSLGMNWHIYATAAKGYSKAGLIDKALLALKKSEELVPRKKTRIAYGFLLSVYTDIGIKDELYRIWNKYKSSEETSVSMYMCMISCLLKLDDISSAEAILKEWELLSVLYDFRVPNLLVAAYCKKGLLCKAESIVRDAVQSGRTPFANTWECLAGSYFEANKIPKAVEIMKKALVAHGNSPRKPKPENISASLEHFKVQQDVKAAEEFVSLLRRVGPLTREVYHCLLSIYVIVGKSVSDVLHRMEEDGFDADEETQKILGSGNSGKSSGDLADRVDLLAKVRGIEHAENYFGNISKRLKSHQPYGALLNCYLEERAVEKAEALFQEMKELDLLSPFCYNILIKLYSLTGLHIKVDAIFHEMEETGISPDNFTYSVLLDAYAVALNICGIDKILRKTEISEFRVHWHIYATAAKGYSKAGLIDKALAALKKSEILVPPGKGRVAYGFLLPLYADIGIKDELYRIWNIYKSSEKTTNSMYMCMISSLLKIDDIKGAEAILEEWELNTTFYDFRVPNLLVAAYCKNGLVGKAESLVSETIENGRTPFANTWSRLAGAYFENGQSPKAVEMMKKALVAAARNVMWKPNPENVSASLEYFKGQKDAEAVEEFVTLLRHLGPLSREIYSCMLDIYDLAGKPVSGVLRRMKEEGFNVVEETGLREVEARKS